MQAIIKLCVAGGGKTTKIIEYIKSLPNKDRVLVISFCNSSVEDITNRIGIKAHTLHSFCIGFGDYEIISNYLQAISIYKDNYFELRSISNVQINNWIMQNNDMQPILHELSLRDKQLNEEFQLLMQNVLQHHDQQTSFTGVLKDFNSNISSLLPTIFSRYDYLVVDEAQDLSPLQLNIIYKMIEEVFSHAGGFAVVGDPQQSIYGFQGASTVEYYNFLNKIRSLCELRALPLKYEQHNATYRFGGNILNKVNDKYAKHISDVKQGEYKHYICKNRDEILQHIPNIDASTMIIFNRNTPLIAYIQNELNMGTNMRIYIPTHFIYKALRCVFNYLTTYGRQNTMSKIELKKSIFDMKPGMLKSVEKHAFNANDMMNYLTTIIILETKIDTLIWSELRSIAQRHISYTSFFLNIPEHLTVTEPGQIRFLTVHSSKGLESDTVIYINEPMPKSKIIMSNGVLVRDFHYSKTTREIHSKYIEEERIQQHNLQYVAMTRARKTLIHLDLVNLI